MLAYRSFVVIGTQLILILAANVTAFELRFEGEIPPEYAQIMWDQMPAVLLIFGSGLWAFGIQQGLWRYVGLYDLGKIISASLVSAAVFYTVIHFSGGIKEYPRIDHRSHRCVKWVVLAGIRLAVRGFREWIRGVSPGARHPS